MFVRPGPRPRLLEDGRRLLQPGRAEARPPTPGHEDRGERVGRRWRRLLAPEGVGRPLLTLLFAAAIPVLLFGGWVAYVAAERERTGAREAAGVTAERAAERVAAEIRMQLEVLEALAASTALDGPAPDLGSFYTEAQRVRRERPLWHTVELALPSGAQVLNLLRPAGEPLGPTVDRESFEEVLRTRRPAVGGIGAVGPISGLRLVALRVPVLREGELRYVLSVGLAPASISAILRSAGAPRGWIGVVVDRRGNVVARTQGEESGQGLPASSSLRDALARAPGGGFYQGSTLEGIEVETVYRALLGTGGWSVHFGIPRELLDAPVRRSVYLLTGGALASLVLATALAFLTARDIEQRRRVEALRAAAALRASEERRAVAVEAAELGTWRWDLARDEVEGSARCAALLGLPPPPEGIAEGAWPARRVLRRVHPADRRPLLGALRRCLRDDAPLDVEFRAGRSRGDTRWVRASGRAQAGAAGAPEGLHGVLADVSPRKRAEAERLELQRRLAQSQEEVQRRIARELHDQVGQTVTGLSLGLKGLERTLPEGDLRGQVRWLQRLAGEIGRDIHRAAADLRPVALDDLGLPKALLAYCSTWSERYGLTVDVQVIGGEGHDGRRLPMEIETVLYRVVQEALTNVLKHAEARNVSVVLERKDGVARLIVEDDGRGFDPDTPPRADARDGPRLGLLGIRERVSLLGGTLTVESAPGAGTTLFVQVPTAGWTGP